MDDRHQRRSGRFYCMNGEGVVKQLPSFGEICITNGPTFSADGEWVYYTDTLEGKIFRAGLDERGNPGASELHIDFGELSGNPDGMCTDTEGGLWVCHFGGSRITRFLPCGSADQVIELPVPNITKCIFGGANLRTLYITTAAIGLDASERQRYPLSGSLFSTVVSYQGFAMPAVSKAVSSL
jgi:D-xylonolactonase